MAKTKRSLVVLARVLVLTLLIGIFAAVPSAEASAATNKALRTKVAFDGQKESDEAWENNSYTLTAAYKNTTKLKKNMKASETVYVPVAALKKNGDTVHMDTFVAVSNAKSGEWVGDVRSNYTVMLIKEGKKVRLGLWNIAKSKEEKIGKYATVKKSGKYYVVTIKNLPLMNKMYVAEEQIKAINTKTKYDTALSVNVTGTCSKTSGYVYADDLKLQAAKTQTITFDKKDYKWLAGWHKDKELKVKVVSVK